jgi:segregation and condensation protein B
MSMDDETTDRDAAAGPGDSPAPDAAGPGEAAEVEAAAPEPEATDVDALIGSDTPASDAPDTADASGLVGIVEALVFASPEPITVKALVKLLDGESKEDVAAALEELTRRYQRSGGLQMVEVANGYQIVTRPELHEWVRRLFHERTTQKLSVQALETLAVIAYKQPITAMEIAEIRGVNTSGVIGTLLERGLVKISGRKQVVGRPFLYSTTREFLDRFGLKDLGDLPKVEDMADALGFTPPPGLAQQESLLDEPATVEDEQVLTGEGGEEAIVEAPDPELATDEAAGEEPGPDR